MATAQPILVCHALPAALRKPTVLATFDTLKSLESFVLVSDHPQTPVLALLQEERPGLFEWSPLEEGPGEWRTEVTRRLGFSTLREVSEALSWDHDRLDELERLAHSEHEAGSDSVAQQTFRTFAKGLRRHIAIEDQIIFPEFERRSGLSPHVGPTAVLRAEHRELEVLLDEMERAMADPSAPITGPRAELKRLLAHHNTKEEQVLYPGTDRLMNAEERDDLVRRAQRFSARPREKRVDESTGQ